MNVMCNGIESQMIDFRLLYFVLKCNILILQFIGGLDRIQAVD